MSTWFERVIRRKPEPLPADATREGLLAAIRERPEDDGPRWVMADWLAAREDPRGEFIAVQLTLAAIDDDDPRVAELEAREQELLAAHKSDWVGRFRGARIEYGVEGGRRWARGNPTRWSFARGFVDTVDMAALDFISNAELLLVEEPVRELHLTQASGLLPRFLDECPRLELLRGLDLSRTKLRDADVDALFSCPRLPALESLNLNLCRLGAKRGQRAFTAVEGSVMPQLRRLLAAENQLGDRGLTALAACPILAKVETLLLTGNKLGAKGARALAASPHLDALAELRLGVDGLAQAERELLRERFGDALLS